MKPVTILSVNVGRPKEVRFGAHQSVSGIDKRAVPGRVSVGELGLMGDHILATRHHGGPDQAVYLYSLEDYGAFAERLGGIPEPGTFGENLTVSGLESADVRIGTRLTAGDLLLEVTASRIPCATFAAHMGDEGFVRTFRQMRRPGLYTRVLHAGAVGVGDVLTVQAGPAEAPTIGEEFELFFDPRPARAALERLLAAPIARRSRHEYQERLARL